MNLIEKSILEETKKNQKDINAVKIVVASFLLIIFWAFYFDKWGLIEQSICIFLVWYLAVLTIVKIIFEQIFPIYKYINVLIDIFWVMFLIDIVSNNSTGLIISPFLIPFLITITVISGLGFEKLYTWFFWFFSMLASIYIISNDGLLNKYSIITMFFMLSIYLSSMYNVYNLKRIVRKVTNLKQLEKFTDSDLLKQIEKNPEILDQEWKEKKLVIFFLDIRWFSKLSETLEAPEIFKTLNIYLGSFSKIIEKNHGIVDKYIWDCIMWYFEGEKKFLHSYTASQEIIQMLDTMNAQSENQIGIGIGMHYGKVFSGWLWNENRMDFTIIGDNVNTTSRLESLTREIDANIAVSKDYYEHLDFENTFKYSGEYSLKWKENKIEVYAI